MPKRANSYVQVIKNQTARFDTLKLTQKEAVKDIAKGTANDLRDLTAGGLPRSATKGAFARGAAPGNGGVRRRGRRSGVPKLPINRQSGRLNASVFAREAGANSFVAGFSSRAGRSVYVVLPGGTSKMVDRGLYGPNGEITKRVAARRKAFRDRYIRKARTA